MQQPKYIILKDKPTIWRLSFNYDELFRTASLKTSYNEDKIADKVDALGNTVILDDDKPMFNYYLAIAISELTGHLARRLDSQVQITDESGNAIINSGMVESDTDVTYYLVMTLNHEAHLLSALWRYCQEFLVRKVLEQWYDSLSPNSEEMRLKIYQILEYRKKPISRPIRPLF